jgi:hypothetical protein
MLWFSVLLSARSIGAMPRVERNIDWMLHFPRKGMPGSELAPAFPSKSLAASRTLLNLAFAWLCSWLRV